MSGKLVFYYIGDDEAYFKALQGEFAKHTRLTIEFKRFFETEESKIQSIFLKVYESSPACVFIDFSKHSQDYLHLARLLTRTQFHTPVLIVGLLDYLSPPAVMNESLVTGVCLSHIKSSETFDVVYDVTKLVAPQAIGEHGFATASLKETWNAGALCKIGYVNPEGIHVETDFEVKAGSELLLNHCWQEKKIIPSRQIVVQNVSSKNLYYHFKHSLDANFNFIDKIVAEEGMNADDLKDREIDRQDKIKKHKKLFNAWIADHVDSSQEKIAKVLIIDKEFHIYRDQKRSDKYSYIIRCVPHLEDVRQELDRLQPQVIAIALEPEGAEAKNNFALLEKLVQVIRVNEEKPFLVVFNTEVTSKELQGQLGYEQLMSASNDLSVDVLLRMAGIFESKLLSTKGKAVGKKEVQKVFLKKTNPSSLADFVVQVNMVKISETDLIFQTERIFPPGTNLRFSQPVPFVANIQPLKAQGNVHEYYGLIHCLGEGQKKELRKYVNSVFFRDHDAQVVGEMDAFKQLNEGKLQEKMDALKKQQEEAEKAEEEKNDGTDVEEKPPLKATAD